MAEVTITINNQKIRCEEGATIVDVARAHGIYIPTICYLGGCSPTLACKMCMAESPDGKRVYTCNTKAKDGLELLTNTPQIQRERQMIMQTYDVNHPLECGVCDKSGECELQNLTLYTKVAHQDYALPDDEKHEKSWAQALYDPNLCIVCERCVTTCKDNIGEAKLKAGKADLHAPDSYKDSMLKDPYSVWSKKQKSLIEFVGDSPCFDCGECIAVCPVGALTYKDFSYSANAWELQKTPSTCAQCAMGCHIVYESRHHNAKGEHKIFRVSNDFHFAPICGAGRFGFSVFSHGAGRSKSQLESIQAGSGRIDSSAGESSENSAKSGNLATFLACFNDSSFQRADSAHYARALRLGENITNEEAMIAQVASECFSLELYNESARAYQWFLPYLRLNHTLEELKNSSVIIALGCPVRLHAPLLQYAINNTIRIKKGVKFYYMHPFGDALLSSFSRSIKHIAYAPESSELALGALLLSLKSALDSAIAENPNASALQHQLAVLLEQILASAIVQEPSIETDIADSGNPIESAESPESNPQSAPNPVCYAALSGIDMDSLSELAGINLSSVSLLVGQEIMMAALESCAIVAALQLLELCGVRVFIIPAGSNTAGIARICTLHPDPKYAPESKQSHAKHACDERLLHTIGIRTQGDVVWDCAWSVLDEHLPSGVRTLIGLESSPDVALPSHQQMQGSMTNFENRVLPLVKVRDYQGDDLASILHRDLSQFVATKRAMALMEGADSARYPEIVAHFSSFTSLSDFSRALPREKGFSTLDSGSLPNFYTQGGEDRRGYMLGVICDKELAPVAPLGACQRVLDPTNTAVSVPNAFISYPQNLFGIQSALDPNMQQKDGFYTSKAHFDALGLRLGEEIMLVCEQSGQEACELRARVYVDYALVGDVWLISPLIVQELGLRIGEYLQVKRVQANTQGLDSSDVVESSLESSLLAGEDKSLEQGVKA